MTIGNDVALCPCRRGSNVSLTLDMCTPGTTEPYGLLLSPRDQNTQEYLEKASNPLTPSQLHTRALDDAVLQAEFYVSLIKTLFITTY